MKTSLNAFIFTILISVSQLVFAQKTEERNVSAFTEIQLRISAKVHLVQGADQSVKITAVEGALERIITEVKNRKLIIRTSAFTGSGLPGSVEIYVTTPQIDGLDVLGSGSIFSDFIRTRIIDLRISGSGDILIKNLEAEKVSSVLSGSGNLELAGKKPAAEFKTVLSGSGNIKAAGFTANDANIKIVGSGNCWITAEKNLIGRIGGSGNIYYRGNPAIDSSIAGSGGIKEANR